MDILNIFNSIFHTAAFVIGAIFIVTGVISLIVSLFERASYKRKAKKAAISDGTKRIAVITGASSGIGKRYAQKVSEDSERFGVDEIWLIARRKEKLEQTAESLKLTSRIIPLDVTAPEAPDLLKKELDEAGNITVTFLANCAGFGKYGSSQEVGHEEECRMIDLNDKAAITVTDVIVPYMRAGARIAQICSVAGFQPIPFFNAYAASKALLYSYSRALRIELREKGISVTAVSPYWVYDTEFISTAAGQGKKPFMSSRSESVAGISLHDIRCRHALSTPGIVCTAERFFAGIIPDELLSYIMPKFL
jgi:short-subunit dehydrogenase